MQIDKNMIDKIDYSSIIPNNIGFEINLNVLVVMGN